MTPFGRVAAVAHEIHRQFLRAAAPYIGEGDDGAAAAHHSAIEVRQISFIEEAQGKALLGRVLFREPGVGHGAQLRQYRGRRSARGMTSKCAPSRFARRCAWRRSARAGPSRENVSSGTRASSPSLLRVQPQIDVQGQILRLDLVEHRRDRHHVAVLQKFPRQGLAGLGRSDGIAHRHPAVAGHLVHDERRAFGVEQQILVAEQGEIGDGVLALGDQTSRRVPCPPRRGIEPGRRRRPQQAPQSVGRGDHGREQRGAQAARRRGVEREFPPQLVVVGHVPIGEYHQPRDGDEHQAQGDDPRARVMLFDQRGAPLKAAACRYQDDDDDGQDRGLLVIETLEQGQQYSGAQQPNGQPPGRVEAPVQAVGDHQQGPRPRRCRANATARGWAAARNRAACPGDCRVRAWRRKTAARRPAKNTAIAMAWGVTAIRKVRTSRTRRTAGPRCTHTSCAPSSARAATKGTK